MDATDRVTAAARDLRAVADDLASALEVYADQGYPQRAGAYGERIRLTLGDVERIARQVERARDELVGLTCDACGLAVDHLHHTSTRNGDGSFCCECAGMWRTVGGVRVVSCEDAA